MRGGGDGGPSMRRSGGGDGRYAGDGPRIKGGDRGRYDGDGTRARDGGRYADDGRKARRGPDSDRGDWKNDGDKRRHAGRDRDHDRDGKFNRHRVWRNGAWIWVYGPDYYASGDDCYWLLRRAEMTGSPYWWRRYQDCVY